MGRQTDELAHLYRKAKEYTETQDNFTIVELSYKGKRAFGVSKRNPTCDPLVPERGYQIAKARALRNLDDKFNTWPNFIMELIGSE